MITVAIYTGQAAIGNMNNFSFYTGQFSTCSPVVLHNAQTNVGALFHLPGKNGNRSKLLGEWQTYIQPIIELVQPTDVWIFPTGEGSTADREELYTIFNEHKTTHSLTYTIHRDNTTRMGIYVSAPNGNLQFSVYRSYTDPEHDMKKKLVAPEGCTVMNLDINYKIWQTLT